MMAGGGASTGGGLFTGRLVALTGGRSAGYHAAREPTDPEVSPEPPLMAQDPSTTLYDGKFIRLVRQHNWEFVQRKNVSGIVGIVAVTDDRRLVLVEQFRPPVGKPVIELPAGLAGDVAGSETEELADAARRELLEETGLRGEEMTRLCAGTASAGLGRRGRHPVPRDRPEEGRAPARATGTRRSPCTRSRSTASSGGWTPRRPAGSWST
jgi:hypothetical protein